MVTRPIPRECWPIVRSGGGLMPQYAEGETCEVCWAWLPAAFTGIGRWMRRRAHRRKWGHDPVLANAPCTTCGEVHHERAAGTRSPSPPVPPADTNPLVSIREGGFRRPN